MSSGQRARIPRNFPKMKHRARKRADRVFVVRTAFVLARS